MEASRPPKAGPTEKPRLIAILFNENERVTFSGFEYKATEEALAGRKHSIIVLVINMPVARALNSVSPGIKKNRQPPVTRLKNCTRKCPILSVSHPPEKEPIMEPRPNMPRIIPASSIL